MLTHSRAPVPGYLLHAPSHLLQIKRVTRNPAHKLILGLVMNANAISSDDSGSLWLATRRHSAPAHRIAINDQQTKYFCHLVEGA